MPPPLLKRERTADPMELKIRIGTDASDKNNQPYRDLGNYKTLPPAPIDHSARGLSHFGKVRTYLNAL